MKTATFKKNVKKTAGIKAAKLGLKQVVKNTNRMNIMRATLGLNVTTGKLIEGLNPYILGEKFTPEMEHEALERFGDIGFAVTALANTLKVKLPTITKKSKLVGTRTNGLLTLHSIAVNMLDTVNRGTFTGPKTVKQMKMVTLPNKGGIKEEREVDVVESEAENALESARQEALSASLGSYIDTLWRVIFDTLKQPPAIVFEAKMDRMKTDYPAIEFDTDESLKAKKAAAKAAKAENTVVQAPKVAAVKTFSAKPKEMVAH